MWDTTRGWRFNWRGRYRRSQLSQAVGIKILFQGPCMKEFSPRKLQITLEEILNLQPAGGHSNHFQAQMWGSQTVLLALLHLHPQGSLSDKPSEADSWGRGWDGGPWNTCMHCSWCKFA